MSVDELRQALDAMAEDLTAAHEAGLILDGDTVLECAERAGLYIGLETDQ